MKTDCKFCGENILTKRDVRPRTIYCSDLCNKRAYYVRNSKGTSIYKLETKEEWLKTETGKSYIWEQWAAQKLGAKHLNAEKFGSQFDLEWNGVLIDVKTAELFKRKFKKGRPTKNISGTWCFHSEAKYSGDYYLCIALIDGSAEKVYYIPREIMPKKGCCIGRHKSKYDEYLIQL